MLHLRLLSAALLISSLVGLMWLDFQLVGFGRPGAWLLPLALFGAALGTKELLALLRCQNLEPSRWATYVGSLFVVAATGVPIYWSHYPENCSLGRLGLPLCAMALAICLVFFAEMARYREPGGVTVRVALGVFVIGYVGLLMSFLVALRLFHDNGWGLAALVSMILVTKMCDTGAYFSGRLVGRHKMTPLLSPKKTWEGAAGGVLLSVASSWFFFEIVLPRWFVTDPAPTAWWRWTVYGALLAVIGMIGDLAESLVKRDMGQKDASQTLPGMGGVLDVLDSLLFTAPFGLLCWAGGLIGPRI